MNKRQKTGQKARTFLAAAALLLWSSLALGQAAELPFFTDKITQPNIMLFIDTSGSMSSAGENVDGPDRTRMQVVRDVLTGKSPYRLLSGTSQVYYHQNVPLDWPELWAGTGIGIKIFTVSQDFSGYFAEPNGDFFVFWAPADTSANDTDSRNAASFLDEYLRNEGETCIILRATADVNNEGVSGTRDIYQPTTDCTAPGAYTFRDAMLRWFYYETTGSEAGGGTNPANVVPLIWQAASSSTWWYNPDPKRPPGWYQGVCYYTTSWQGCYRPTNDLTPNRFAIYEDFGITTAEELNNYRMTFDAYRVARGNFNYYCPQAQEEVWGDRPYADWTYTFGGRPRSDGNTRTVRQSYRSCNASDSGAIGVADPLPTEDAVKTAILNRLLRITMVDKYGSPAHPNTPDGTAGPEFIVTLTGTRIDVHLRSVKGLPAKPDTDFSIDDPTWGGFFNDLFYYEIWQGDPGILDIYPNVNYGVMTFDNSTNCTNSVSPAVTAFTVAPNGNNSYNYRDDEFLEDSEDDCTGGDLRYNIISWAEFPAYSTTNSAQNAALQTYISTSSQLNPDGYTPIASSLHDIFRYMFNKEFTASGSGHDTTPSMYYDLGWPAPFGSANDHIIQEDPFFLGGCRRNYLIYLTDGEQTSGEPLGYTDTNPDSTEVTRIVNAQRFWVRKLAEGADCGRLPANKRADHCGVRSYFIGFGLTGPSASQLNAMAAEAAAGFPQEEDGLTVPILATDPETVHAAFTKIMNTILAGQYARTAPEVSIAEDVILTSYFDVTGLSPLWRGHLFAWVPVVDGDTVVYEPLFGAVSGSSDAAINLNNTASADREFHTAFDDGGGLDDYEITTANVSLLCPLLYPLRDCSDSGVLTDATNLINFIRAENTATFDDGTSVDWKMGALYHSKPRVVTYPRNFFYALFPGYQAFAAKYADRPPMIFIGSMYGFLHVLNLHESGDLHAGEEIFAYMPEEMLQYAHNLKGGKQMFGVDALTVTNDLYFPNDPDVDDGDGDLQKNKWHTVTVSGMGGGGEAYFALDVTQANTTDRFDNVTTLWNFKHDNLAFTWSIPVTGFVGYDGSPALSQPAAFFGGGLQDIDKINAGSFTPNKGGYFYVVDAESGDLMKVLELYDKDQVTDLDPLTVSGDTNWNQVPGSPILLDTDGDNVFERAYVGDLQGRLWKVNMAFGDTALWEACIVYDMADENGDGDLDDTDDLPDDERRPIWYTPLLVRGYNNQLIIYFYTGHVEIKDAATNAASRDFLFAVVDDDTDLSCTYGEPLTVTGQTVNFPLAFAPGEKPTSDMLITGGELIFPTYSPSTTSACSPGTIKIYRVEYLTGDTIVIDVTPGAGHAIESGGGALSITGQGRVIVNPPNPGPPQELLTVTPPRAMPMSWGEGIVW